MVDVHLSISLQVFKVVCVLFILSLKNKNCVKCCFGFNEFDQNLEWSVFLLLLFRLLFVAFDSCHFNAGSYVAFTFFETFFFCLIISHSPFERYILNRFFAVNSKQYVTNQKYSTWKKYRFFSLCRNRESN